ncbi:MAG: 4Fe-4S cluster-binding domain-containing protein [Pirellulales bacterium]|nr:4Fe-4S cluster-binding domain-containing protein [Pirellulales bacterium]
MSILSSLSALVRPKQILAENRSWRMALKDAVRDMEELCRLLHLPNELAAGANQAIGQFPLFVPRGYLARIQPGSTTDPLLLQVLPTAAEMAEVPGFSWDPVGDQAAIHAPGLLKKFSHRALLLVTHRCAVACRYCFRRHFRNRSETGLEENIPLDKPRIPCPGDDHFQNRQAGLSFRPALEALAADPSIHEIILSGGDPLMVVDPILASLIDRLARIEHIQRLRIHTRLPIMIPERVTSSLISWLTGSRLVPIVVIHVNHPQEIDAPVTAALGRFVDAGIPVLNQAVLLAGVNDSVSVQQALCERLINRRVIPYYLHLLDPVAGAAHFQVPMEKGRAIVEALRTQLPGYAVPRLVREVKGADTKILVA